MNLGRIFANAVARRVAAVLVALFFAAVASLVGIADAHAQACPAPTGFNPPGGAFQYEGQARAACIQDGLAGLDGKNITGFIRRFDGCQKSGTTYRAYETAVKNNSTCAAVSGSSVGRGNNYSFTVAGCPPGETWDDVLQACSACVANDQTPTFPSMINVYRCPVGQCAQLATACSSTGPTPNHVCWTNVGGSKCTGNEPCPAGYTKDPNSGLCMPPQECPEGTIKDANGNCLPPNECPEGTVKDQFGLCKPKNNECPAGQIKSPEGKCLPGDGQCDAGSVRGKDGTCKKDKDGDGKPDDEDGDGDEEDGNGEGDDESTFSGGENCNAPPVCSGDNIMCGQARIQWRIDCNTRKNAVIAGGQCGVVPQCTGDGCKALDYAILLTTWRTACALETAKDGIVGNEGQPEWTKVAGMSQNPGEGEGPGDTAGVTSVAWSPESLDGSGWIGGSAIGIAPGGGGVLASGYLAVFANPPAIWVEYIAWIKAILIALTALGCAFFLARG